LTGIAVVFLLALLAASLLALLFLAVLGAGLYLKDFKVVLASRLRAVFAQPRSQ
jgi:hypothetical protein